MRESSETNGGMTGLNPFFSRTELIEHTSPILLGCLSPKLALVLFPIIIWGLVKISTLKCGKISLHDYEKQIRKTLKNFRSKI